MQTICIKLEDSFKKEIERMMKQHLFSTMTEFVREAIRDKMQDLEWETVSPEKLKWLEKRAKEAIKNVEKESYTIKDLKT